MIQSLRQKGGGRREGKRGREGGGGVEGGGRREGLISNLEFLGLGGRKLSQCYFLVPVNETVIERESERPLFSKPVSARFRKEKKQLKLTLRLNMWKSCNF